MVNYIKWQTILQNSNKMCSIVSDIKVASHVCITLYEYVVYKLQYCTCCNVYKCIVHVATFIIQSQKMQHVHDSLYMFANGCRKRDLLQHVYLQFPRLRFARALMWGSLENSSLRSIFFQISSIVFSFPFSVYFYTYFRISDSYPSFWRHL